jgi:hypothetical protein
MRTRACLVLSLVWAADARGAMMQHYDLVGLLFQSDAVVVAERAPSTQHADRGHYRVVRTLRGTMAMGSELELDDSLYDLSDAEPRFVLFLSREAGELVLVSSGLRCTVEGQVYRFEQWNNPGGWTRVLEGTDPADPWQQTAELDMAGFERALAAAQRRIDAFSVADAELDPVKRRASLLALLPADAVHHGAGFYVDRLAARVKEALLAHGDLEGALIAHSRDQSFAPPLAVPSRTLLDYALDDAHDAALRVVALGLLAYRRTLDASNELRGRLVHQYLVEREPAVLYELVVAYQMQFWRALPARRDRRSLFARAELDKRTGMLRVSVLAARGEGDLAYAKLIARREGVVVRAPRYAIEVRSVSPRGGGALSTTHDGDRALAPGTYSLTLEPDLVAHHPAQALGTLTVSADGVHRLAPATHL